MNPSFHNADHCTFISTNQETINVTNETIITSKSGPNRGQTVISGISNLTPISGRHRQFQDLCDSTRMRASVILPRRLSRQIIRKLEAITTPAPASTVGSGHSFQIIQPNSVAQTMLL